MAASFALATPHFAASLAAGAAVEAVNLGAIHRLAKKLFSGSMLAAGWVGVLTTRLVLLGTAIYLAMWMGAHPVALLIGLSITMPATLIDAWLNRPPVIDPAELPTFIEDWENEDGDLQHAMDRDLQRGTENSNVSRSAMAESDGDDNGENVWSTGDLMTSFSAASFSVDSLDPEEHPAATNGRTDERN